MDTVLRDLKSIESTYGEDVVTLTVSSRYLAHIFANPRVERYLRKNYADLLTELQSLLTALQDEKISPTTGAASTLSHEGAQTARAEEGSRRRSSAPLSWPCSAVGRCSCRVTRSR